uniref:SFRICE_037146 n=1 Tax=Spodoptera frugiperda TaxID=7108 RepID=A0A2H1W347_SPOFR
MGDRICFSTIAIYPAAIRTNPLAKANHYIWGPLGLMPDPELRATERVYQGFGSKGRSRNTVVFSHGGRVTSHVWRSGQGAQGAGAGAALGTPAAAGSRQAAMRYANIYIGPHGTSCATSACLHTLLMMKSPSETRNY